MKIIAKAPLWLIISLFALSHTSETVILIALPSLGKYLSVEDNFVQLSSSVYFMGFALGILSWGRISDIIGRRPVMLSGLIIYFLCVTYLVQITNIYQLLFIRFFQAFGVSVASVACQAMMRDSFKGYELTDAFVSISIGVSLVPSIGPVIGGYLVEYLGWKYNFLFLSLMSLTMFIVCLFKLPETNANIGAPASGKYFFVIKSVLKDKKAIIFALIIGLFNGIMFGFYMTGPFIFIKQLGVSPSFYGKFGFALSFAVLMGSYLNKKLIKKYIDPHRIILSGQRISLIGCGCLVFSSLLILGNYISNVFAASLIICSMVIHLIGHSLVVPTSLKLGIDDYNKVIGTAGSVFGFLYYTIVACVNFFISRFYTGNILFLGILFFLLSLMAFLSFSLYFKDKRMREEF